MSGPAATCEHRVITRVQGQNRAWCEECTTIFVSADETFLLAMKLKAARALLDPARDFIILARDALELPPIALTSVNQLVSAIEKFLALP